MVNTRNDLLGHVFDDGELLRRTIVLLRRVMGVFAVHPTDWVCAVTPCREDDKRAALSGIAQLASA